MTNGPINSSHSNDKSSNAVDGLAATLDTSGTERSKRIGALGFPRWAKYIAGGTVGFVLIIGGGGFLATQLIDQSKYKKIIVEKVSEISGYNLEWDDDIAFSLMPLPHATIKNLQIANGNQKIITVKKADIEVELIPLLSKKIKIRTIELYEPSITLTTLEDGHKNWMTATLYKVESSEAVKGQSINPDTEKDDGFDISLDMLQIFNGTLIWDDQSKSIRQKFEDIDVTSKADSMSGPFDVNGGLVWNGRKIEAKLTTPTLDFKNAVYPIKLQMALPESNVIFSYGGTVEIKDTGPVTSGDVSLNVDNLKFAIESIAQEGMKNIPNDLSGKTSLDGKIYYDSNRILLNNMRLQSGKLAYLGDLAVKFSEAKQFNQESVSPALDVSFAMKSAEKVPNDSSTLEKFLDDLSIDAKGSVSDDNIHIDSGEILIDANDLTLSGNVAIGANKNIALNLASKSLDIDQILEKLSDEKPITTSQMSNITQDSSGAETFGFDLPFQGKLETNLANITYQGLKYQNIKSELELNNKSLMIKNFSAQLPSAATIVAHGKIGNTTDLSDMGITFDANIPDTEELAQIYHFNLPQLSRKIGASNLKATISGSPKQLSFNATTGIWGMSVTGIGTVANLIHSPVINQIKFAVSSPDFVQSIRLLQPDFRSTGGFEGPFKISGDAVWENSQYHLNNLQGVLGKTSLDGSLNITTDPKMSVNGTVNLGRVVLSQKSESATDIATTSKNSAHANNSNSNKWSREAINLGWMHNFDASLKITAQSIIYDLWTLNQAKMDFTLNDGQLKIADTSAALFGGQVLITGAVKSGIGLRDPLSIEATLKGENISARPLMSAAIGKNNDRLSGQIRKADINIAATGLSPAALVQTLNGSGAISGADIVVKGIDAAQLATAARGSFKPLERAESLFSSFQNGQTQFSTVDCLFTVQNGIVNFSKILFDGDQANLSSTGKVNLPQWWVELTNSMTIKNTDIPSFDFTIKGPLDNPVQAGGATIENYLRGRLQDKVINKQLNKLLKLPEAQNSKDTNGTNNDIIDKNSAYPDENKPEDMLKKEAAKALGGLLGQ